MRDLLDILPPASSNGSGKCLKDLPLAYAYVPYQEFDSTYNMDESLNKGTVFPELYKPMRVYGNEFSKAAEVEHND